MATLLILFLSSGLLLAALGVPLILRKIGPNPLYGFRVQRTLEDPGVWYPANAYAGKRLLVMGLLIAAGAIVLFLVPGVDLLIYALANAGIGLAGLLLAVIQSFLYLRSLPGTSETVSSNQPE